MGVEAAGARHHCCRSYSKQVLRRRRECGTAGGAASEVIRNEVIPLLKMADLYFMLRAILSIFAYLAITDEAFILNRPLPRPRRLLLTRMGTFKNLQPLDDWLIQVIPQHAALATVDEMHNSNDIAARWITVDTTKSSRKTN